MTINTSNPGIVPDYLTRTTKGISWAALSVIFPFGIFSYIQGRHYLSILAFVTVLICILYLVSCRCGKCNRIYVSTVITPLIIISMTLIIYKLGIIGAYWSIPAAISLYFLLSEKIAWLANLVFISIIIPVAWSVLDQQVAIRFIAVLLGASLFSAIAIREITRQQDILKKQAIMDTLTGVYNRSLLQHSLVQAIEINNRTGEPMSLIMLDIDHFKKINDDLGHDSGDYVLKEMGKILKSLFRSSDMVFRIGGEEFLVLVYNADVQTAVEMAEKLRSEIEHHPIIENHTVTASIGVAGYQHEISWEEWLKQSDENLYLAKSGGRNRVAMGKS